MAKSLLEELKDMNLKNQIISLNRNIKDSNKVFKIVNQNGEEGWFLTEYQYNSIQRINFKIKSNLEKFNTKIQTYEDFFNKAETNLKSENIYSMRAILEQAINELNIKQISKENINLNMEKDFYIKLPNTTKETFILNILKIFKGSKSISNVKIWMEKNRIYVKKTCNKGPLKVVNTKYFEYFPYKDIIEIQDV
ncbi:MAG: hypothetical protein GY830_00140 [Bacteroidetes bacterium]|nr:hypothetical protein [Bacteroidota bacterium]